MRAASRGKMVKSPQTPETRGNWQGACMYIHISSKKELKEGNHKESDVIFFFGLPFTRTLGVIFG